MSRIRADYEQTKWRRFVRFVNGEQLYEKEQDELADAAKNEQDDDFFREKTEERSDMQLYLKRRELEDLKESVTRYHQGAGNKGVTIFNRIYRVVSLGICIAMITVLLVTVANLPPLGAADTPANSNEVAKRYIENGQEETGAVNIVTGMILDYRAFDTLGESHVLFIAACAVLILLRLDRDKNGNPGRVNAESEEDDRRLEPKNDKILQKATFILVPVIFIFGIYVILNGHISPGGGFSGGAIIGAGLILYLSAFGFRKIEQFFTAKTFTTISLCALLFYGGSKCYSFFCGANHLESGIPQGTPGNILSSGLILPLNICVGMVVACTMYAFFAIFRRGSIGDGKSDQ